jgi:hypothetical protein
MDMTSLDGLTTFAGEVSFAAFILATVLLFVVVSKLGKSAMQTIVMYLAMATGIFVAISAFLTLGADFFRISDNSVDVWWHILFYMSFAFYFVALRTLVGLGSAEVASTQEKDMNQARLWGFIALCGVVLVFLLPSWTENIVLVYANSPLDSWGLHHIIAFIFAGGVAAYLWSARENLGQIGRLIANPIIVAVAALSLQHLWELLNESWKVIKVSDTTGEGVEKIFLIIAAASLIWGGWKLYKFAQATAAAPSAAPTI